MKRWQLDHVPRSAVVCAACDAKPVEAECAHRGCLDGVCRECQRHCEGCGEEFCPTHAVEFEDGHLCLPCSEEAKGVMAA